MSILSTSRFLSKLLKFSRVPRNNGYVMRCCHASNNTRTMSDLKKTMAGIVSAQMFYSPKPFARSHLHTSLPKSQDELPSRKMSDSYDECIIPIGSNEGLREMYVNYRGGVRFGRILEDLDVFAVWLCHKHCVIPGHKAGDVSPLAIVTAFVDKIDLVGRHLNTDGDIRLSGKVTWVGKSSMESTMKVEQFIDGQWNQHMDACFVLVARDPNNGQTAFVNPLVPDNDEESKLLLEGLRNLEMRQKMSSESLMKHPPNQAEQGLIHDLFLKTVDPSSNSFKARIKPQGHVSMEEAKLKNVIICHPQERNPYNKIFGGFLMRQALEIAWANAFYYSKSRPYITYVDDIWFRKPVDIGSLLYLLSQVVYTDGENMQIRVHADVVNPELGTRDTTNIFHFTFRPVNNKPVPSVIPMAYHEAMLYLDGKRHLEEAVGYNLSEK